MGVFLETGRLELRAFTEVDAADVLALDGDPEVMRFVNGGRPTTERVVREETLPRLMRRYACWGLPGYWAAREPMGGGFLGWFEFRPVDERESAVVELGYRLNRAAWGRGYATEGARALIDRGFEELGVERVTANTMAVNVRSRRVMVKAGLRFVRRFTEEWPELIEGGEHGEVEYGLSRAEWTRGR
ncbi:GNAT family N-acetyltransferase, partial [Streptomyces alkaliterrae]